LELSHITYRGPAFDSEASIATHLPSYLRSLLEQLNGFVQFGGGLHVRGVCAEPHWHNLERVMVGELALHIHYPQLLPSDIPFAQDCVADQFILRDGAVLKLHSETGDIEKLGLKLYEFFASAQEGPVEFLGMQPLIQYHHEGGKLLPGQVLSVYPPFCTKESANGVSLKAISAEEALRFLFEFSRHVASLSDGSSVSVKVIE